jgi:hypothetical protein
MVTTHGLGQMRSMEQHTIAAPYESLDFLTSPQRVKISDVSTADVVFVAEQLTYWDAVSAFVVG